MDADDLLLKLKDMVDGLAKSGADLDSDHTCMVLLEIAVQTMERVEHEVTNLPDCG